MGRKRIKLVHGKIVATDSPEETKPEETQSEKPADHPEIFENNRRVAFTVDSEGRIDVEKLQDKTKIQLKEIFSRPSELRKLGLSPSVSKQIADNEFGEDEANALLSFITMVDAPIAARLYNVPKSIAKEAFTFDDYHRSKLNPPMIRLMNKWGPSVLKTYKDEVGFALIMFSTLSSQVMVMNALEEKRKASLPANSQPNVTPINRQPATNYQPPQPVHRSQEEVKNNDWRTEPFVAQNATEAFLENVGLAI